MAKPTNGTMIGALDWAYMRALDGLPGCETAEELAREYLRGARSPSKAVSALVRWQVAKSSASGFVTGLGGLMALPVTVPADLASTLYVQLRMIAAIASIGGHDPRSDRVRALAYLCLCGDGLKEVAQQAGVQMGKQLARQAISRLSGETIKTINKQVGFRLLTKFGEKGLVNLGKLVPVAGGLVGAAFGGVSTYGVGLAAREVFLG